ncbi:hypothetical protein ACFSTA_17190 [Ornithinibacillus salinisoli]|uniref:VOC domain-containing protein n=1 Tax=Ornithinibacillus salinisoli TaxID=1848459 RepID=A0ABW4W0U1_9BACI
MQLFHYHWWTNKVEELENFYANRGFEVSQRVGRYKGEMQTFNSPLTWEDFREETIFFRIIEMRKGQINVTFGNGKTDRFDHIGFLVDSLEYMEIVKRAVVHGLLVSEGERRTFISTPWKFRIELQQRNDAVTEDSYPFIDAMKIQLPFKTSHPKGLAELFGWEITQEKKSEIKLESENFAMLFKDAETTLLEAVRFQIEDRRDDVDPVGVGLFAEID